MSHPQTVTSRKDETDNESGLSLNSIIAHSSKEYIPTHSDYTVRAGNHRSSPPADLTIMNGPNCVGGRRSVIGPNRYQNSSFQPQRSYGKHYSAPHEQRHDVADDYPVILPFKQGNGDEDSEKMNNNNNNNGLGSSTLDAILQQHVQKEQQNIGLSPPISPALAHTKNSNTGWQQTLGSKLSQPSLSPLTPINYGSTAEETHSEQQQEQKDLTPVTELSSSWRTRKYNGEPNIYISHEPVGTVPAADVEEDDTLHAQCLILGLAFFAIWSPQNCMAPNLTQMATDFGFTTETQRDFYLGANLALATGVLSFPVAGFIGFLADIVVSRKYLFAGTAFLGGVASIATGHSQTYSQLYIARFINGGFMSGSVPVAFSLLGDLFDTHQRNAASSGLTAMMGAGIISGQVLAGVVGDTKGWKRPFYVCGYFCMACALLVTLTVREPVRGGKEKVLQDMIRQGSKYDRQLTWAGFIHALHHNASNRILMWQGFFSSLPWGMVFVFLNDYLSQEQGLSVPDATYLVFMFGLGCAIGGVLGGYLGQVFNSIDRSYLPMFMAASTFLGIFPFLLLLNVHFHTASIWSSSYALLGGIVASLPSVNVRPCLINVNPPETRGAALTAANLIIQLARGLGPSLISIAAIWGIDRQNAFNITIISFWTITSIQLILLARTLPHDQDAMDQELALYAASALAKKQAQDEQQEEGLELFLDPDDIGEGESIISIDDRIITFDAEAARESLEFMSEAFREIIHRGYHARSVDSQEERPRPSNWRTLYQKGYGDHWGLTEENPPETRPLNYTSAVSSSMTDDDEKEGDQGEAGNA